MGESVRSPDKPDRQLPLGGDVLRAAYVNKGFGVGLVILVAPPPRRGARDRSANP